jgi:hypothetical protein
MPSSGIAANYTKRDERHAEIVACYRGHEADDSPGAAK